MFTCSLQVMWMHHVRVPVLRKAVDNKDMVRQYQPFAACSDANRWARSFGS